MRFKKNILKNSIFIYSFILVSLICIIYYFYYVNQKMQVSVHLLSEENFNSSFQVSTFLLFLLIIIILLSTQYLHSKIVRSNAIKLQSRGELEIINTLYNGLQQFDNVKDISHHALKFLVKQLDANYGKLYIVDYLNEQLHLSGEFNICVENEERILPIYRGIIGEAVAFKKVKQQKNDHYHKLYIPLINDKKTIAVIVLQLKISEIDYEFCTFHQTIMQIITDFLRNELKNEENQKYFNLIDNYVITSSTNKEGIITYASKAFERFHGYQKDELLGKSHRIIKATNAEDGIFKQMWESISKGNIWNHEIENKKKDNSACWLNTTIQPDFDYYDNIIGY
ncbi:MAG: PAS domain-containing protein, partial [Arcobacteraceae bacterium]